MKKIATVLALGAAVVTSFGQGYVDFANTSGSQNFSTNAATSITGASTGLSGTGLTSGSGVAPSGYYFALLMQSYSGSGATVNSTLANVMTGGWSFSGALGNNVLGAGRIGGGAAAATTAGDVIAGANQFLIVGWSASLGTTWSAIANELTSYDNSGSWSGPAGYLGISTTGTGVGQANTSPEILFGGATGIQGPTTLFATGSATVVPEPTTMALAGLGAGALLLFRRRK